MLYPNLPRLVLFSRLDDKAMFHEVSCPCCAAYITHTPAPGHYEFSLEQPSLSSGATTIGYSHGPNGNCTCHQLEIWASFGDLHGSMKRKRTPSAILCSEVFETGSNLSADDQRDVVSDYNPKEGSANDSTSDSSDDYVPPEKKRKSKNQRKKRKNQRQKKRCSFQCLFHLVRV